MQGISRLWFETFPAANIQLTTRSVESKPVELFHQLGAHLGALKVPVLLDGFVLVPRIYNPADQYTPFPGGVSCPGGRLSSFGNMYERRGKQGLGEKLGMPVSECRRPLAQIKRKTS
ncbi:hypothetical protein TESG_08619 [Trichophyton tonsurans CBS 112818]|uniref:Uncharacterized protein n=1 Tax=Trichophyton tonsurans (strain CBS 112818) TaxID=647933 RepID=F2S8J3_TRIT1|nr:hypothetical protein TESG_08619 [Trichophyton tonsurans CBS 112818]